MAILAGAAREMIVRARTASGAGTGAVTETGSRETGAVTETGTGEVGPETGGGAGAETDTGGAGPGTGTGGAGAETGGDLAVATGEGVVAVRGDAAGLRGEEEAEVVQSPPSGLAGPTTSSTSGTSEATLPTCL